MEFDFDYNGHGGLRFDVRIPPAVGTRLIDLDTGARVAFREVGHSGMLLCTDEHGATVLCFPHRVSLEYYTALPAEVEKAVEGSTPPPTPPASRIDALRVVAEAMEVLGIAHQVLHKVFFLGQGERDEAAYSLAQVEAHCIALRDVIGAGLVDLHRVEIMAEAQAAARATRQGDQP